MVVQRGLALDSPASLQREPRSRAASLAVSPQSSFPSLFPARPRPGSQMTRCLPSLVSHPFQAFSNWQAVASPAHTPGVWPFQVSPFPVDSPLMTMDHGLWEPQ